MATLTASQKIAQQKAEQLASRKTPTTLTSTIKTTPTITPTKSTVTPTKTTTSTVDTKPAWLDVDITGKPASGSNNPEYGGTRGSTSSSTGNGDITSIYDTLLKGSQDAVNASTDATVSEALYQKSLLKPQYDEARSGAYTGSRLSAIGNNEVLASQGLSGALYGSPTSGTSETSRVAQDTALRNAINTFTKEELGAMNTLDREILKAKTAGNVELARLASENRANLMQALMDKKEQDAAAKKEEDIATIGQYGGDYQAEYNKRIATNPNDPLLPYLKMAHNEKASAQLTAAAEAEQQAFDNQMELERLNISKYNAYKTSADDEEPLISDAKMKSLEAIALKNATDIDSKRVDYALYQKELAKMIEMETPKDTSKVAYNNINGLYEETTIEKFAEKIKQWIASGKITEEDYSNWYNSK